MSDPITILVCEDEANLRADLCAELAEAGYLPVAVADGIEAQAQLARFRPDLVLCDIAMPRLDGRALLRGILATRPDMADVPFLFLTAYADRRDIIDGHRAGADDYLVKPVDFELLLATIETRLRQVGRLRARFATRLKDAQDAIHECHSGGYAALDRLAPGLVLIDHEGRLLHANPAARRHAIEGGGIVIQGDSLMVTQPGTNLGEVLRDLHGRPAGSAVSMSLPRETSPRNLVLLLERLDAPTTGTQGFIGVLIDPDHRPVPADALLSDSFGLTPTESRVCALLAEGARPNEIAEMLRVSPTTVAFHLANAFDKTGTNRQSDLVALILSVGALG